MKFKITREKLKIISNIMILISIVFTSLSGMVLSPLGDLAGWYIFCSLFLFFPLMFGSTWKKMLSLSLFLLILWLMNDDVNAGQRYYHKQVMYIVCILSPFLSYKEKVPHIASLQLLSPIGIHVPSNPMPIVATSLSILGTVYSQSSSCFSKILLTA